MCVGGYVGSWVTPLLLTIAYEGWSGLVQIPVANHTAQLPDWVGPPRSVTRALAVIAYGLPIIAGLVVCGRFGERFYRYLVVEKLHWLTHEEVDEARRHEKQYF
jgi:hypothetical protein